ALLGAHALGRGLQSLQLARGEIALDDLLDATGADRGLDPEVDAADAVLAIDPGAGRDRLARVGDHRAGHAGRRGRRRVVGRTGLEQRDDLGAPVAGAGDELLDHV